MYRSCPEHPAIKEILKNGEAMDSFYSGRRSLCAERKFFELTGEQTVYLSEKDFVEICLERRKRKKDCHK